jgi:PadR family transcriptional regulator PadR
MQNKHMEPIRRLTQPTVAVLRVLLGSDEPVWGLRVAKVTGRAPGSIYPILARLEDSGWIVGEWEDDDGRVGPRRRTYALTVDGADRAAATLATWDARAVRPPVRSARTAQA